MKRYPCIGGPLSGRKVTSAELLNTVLAKRSYGSVIAGDVLTMGGRYGDVGEEYHAYNRASGSRAFSRSNRSTMVWLHESLL